MFKIRIKYAYNDVTSNFCKMHSVDSFVVVAAAAAVVVAAIVLCFIFYFLMMPDNSNLHHKAGLTSPYLS